MSAGLNRPIWFLHVHQDACHKGHAMAGFVAQNVIIELRFLRLF